MGLTDTNTLVTFDSASPALITKTTPISGLAAYEAIVGIDFRPANQKLYGLGTSSRIYSIDGAGVATALGAAPFTPALLGYGSGIDFNPIPDRLRVVTDALQNLRLQPDTGVVAGTDTPVSFALTDANAYVIPSIAGVAYANNFPGAQSTSLYGIDSDLDVLVLQGSLGGTPTSPNTGLLTTLGPLGVDSSYMLGFDISPNTGTAFAAISPQGSYSSNLYTVDLKAGAATMVAPFQSTLCLRDLSVVTSVPAANIFGLTQSGMLISFKSQSPGVIDANLPVTGLMPGETLLGIDVRPKTGELYGLGSTSRVYKLNRLTGAATMVGAGPFAPAIDGTEVGFDFNPSVDKMRVVTNTRQNFRVDPDTGVLAGTDTSLAYAATDANSAAMPVVTGSAYTNNIPGGKPTTLYGIDSMLNVLVTQGSVNATPVTPNTGMLFTVGALNVNTSLTVGFDISATGDAFMALNPEGTTRSTLYGVDLATGTARSGQLIGVTELVRDIAIELPIPPPAPPAGADAGADAAAPAADAGATPDAGGAPAPADADAGAGAGADAGAGAGADAGQIACVPMDSDAGAGGGAGSTNTFSCSFSPTGSAPVSSLGVLGFAAALLGGLRRRMRRAKSNKKA